MLRLIVLLGGMSHTHAMVHAGFDSKARQSYRSKLEMSTVGRRKILHDIGRSSLSGVVVVLNVATGTPPALAVWPFESKERRQLEVCMVALLRLLYWAQSLTADLSTTSDNASSESVNRRKQAYLEARLEAKALITGKIGGGASYRAYTLSKLDLLECLDDLEFWYSQTIPTRWLPSTNNMNPTTSLKRDLIESLASIVEFDGLETTQDPSPRFSLMLTMYNDDKGKYVQRMLTERVIPITDELVNFFGPEARRISENYISKYYPNEFPAAPPRLDSSLPIEIRKDVNLSEL
jgi:hypothetical protein